MRKWLLCLLIFAAPAFAQYTANVSGNVRTISPNLPPNTNGSYVEFTLVNCGNNTPMVNGVAVLMSGPVDFFVDATGAITAAANSGIQPALYGNDAILCGASQTSRYSVRYFVGGIATGPAKFYYVASNVPFNLSTAQPITLLPPLVYPNTTTCPAGSFASGINRDLSVQCTNLPGTGVSDAVVVDPSASQTIGPQPLILQGPLTAPIVNNVVIAGTYASLNAASAACPLGGGCTIEVNSNVALAANLILPATTALRFNRPGMISLAGFTLTTGNVIAGPYQIFSGAVILGAQVSRPLVEWFGAVGDWNGTTGTDNTTPIQNCINALTAGQCVLQAQPYKITAALSYTKSNTGLRGQTRSVRSPTIYAAPTGSILITTSTTANLINVTGTSTSNNIVFNQFNDFTLERSTTASTSAARGMQFNFTYGVAVDGVVVEDSPGGFYVHGSGSQDLGGFTNDVVAWGYAGFTETSGSYCGFCIDSLDGTPSPSLRISKSGTFSNLGSGVTTDGISDTGTSLEDLHVDHYETAGLSYGEVLQTSSSPISATDIHLWDTINDGCQISCMLITTGTAPSSVEISGGWSYRAGSNTAPVIDLEGASNVTLAHMDIYFPTAGPGVKVSAGSNNTITGNQFLGSATSSAVFGTGTQYLTVTDNQMPNITATNIINFASVTHGIVANNTISGTGTNGILLDASTHGIAGLASNAVNGTFTAAVSDLGINPTQPLYFQLGGNGSVYQIRQQIRVTGSPLCSAASNSNCSFTLTWPKAFPDSNWAGICTVESSSGSGVIWSVSSVGKTPTTAVVWFQDIHSATNNLTQAVCEGWE